MNDPNTLRSLSESVTASNRLAAEATEVGNTTYAAANSGFADGCAFALRLLAPGACAECHEPIPAGGAAHVDCDAPGAGLASDADGYAPLPAPVL